jgi:DNA-binding transcriptional MocR family regulator
MVYKFISTSKVSFPGSGVAAITASKANLEDFAKTMSIQTIGHDKVNQLRHVRFFKDIDGMREHMKKHAAILRPKFEAVWKGLEENLAGLEIGTWTKPRGGYFISFDSLEGCAKRIVAKAKEAGVVMTPAGATFPYGKDPKDSNIRIAPSFPTPEELAAATEVFVLSVKLVSAEKLLENM